MGGAPPPIITDPKTASFILEWSILLYFSTDGENDTIPDFALMSGSLVLGATAAPNNTVVSEESCFTITIASDVFKESVEMLTFGLLSSDDGVCLGRDVAVARIEANGSMYICMGYYMEWSVSIQCHGQYIQLFCLGQYKILI